MRTAICALVVVVCATPAFAQFAATAAERARNKPADPPAEKPADPPAVDPNAAAPAVGDAAGGASDAIFAALDADGDGTISKNELKKAITALKKLDTDKDGNITRAECSLAANAVAGGPAAPNANPEAAQWMDRIMASDKNKDGKLSANELNENEKQMLQNSDLNGDTFVDRDELQAFVNNQNALAGAANAFNGVGGNLPPNGRRGGNQAMGFFLQYDTNQDGKLSANEIPPQMMRTMSNADLNRDGVIDAREYQGFAQQMGDRMKMLGAGLNPNNPVNPGNNRGRQP